MVPNDRKLIYYTRTLEVYDLRYLNLNIYEITIFKREYHIICEIHFALLPMYTDTRLYFVVF